MIFVMMIDPVFFFIRLLGLEKLDAQIVEWMNRYNVTADTWVLPPKPAMYLSLVPQEKIYYYLAGEEVRVLIIDNKTQAHSFALFPGPASRQ